MRTISGDLSVSGLEKIISQLQRYSDSLEAKNRRFVERLAEMGIRVAQEFAASGTHTMPQRIRFEKEIESDGGYTLGVVSGIGEPFISEWKDAAGEWHLDEVYPMAMMEFGSAALATPPQEAFGGYGGRGTFSVSGNENRVSWYVTKIDESGNEVHRYATAIAPTMPLYSAMLEMRNQIVSCAKSVFGGDGA